MFLYCHAYLTENPEVKSLMPVIYKLASMSDSGVMLKGGRGSQPTQYVFSMQDPIAQDFIAQMNATVKSLYQDDFV